MKQVRIAIDFENNAETWWDAARADGTCMESARAIVHGSASAVVVPENVAKAFRAWGATFPGWSDGPSYAPHPFTFNPAE